MKYALVFVFTLVALPALAQKAPEPTSEAMDAGAAAGRFAGKADFCLATEDDLEDYISLAHARIAIAATDKLDRVLGELEFSNHYSMAKTREPPEGCEAVLKALPSEREKLK